MLTNQPVVIDNVINSYWVRDILRTILTRLVIFRVQVSSKLVLPVKSSQSASSHHCMKLGQRKRGGRLGVTYIIINVICNIHSVGRPKHVRIMAGAVEGDTFIGRKAQELRGLLKIRYPIEHGIVTDWEDMERIWQYIYTDELKTLSEEVGLAAALTSP